MKFRYVAAALVFAGTCVAADVPTSKPVVVDEIVAKVNGDIVTRHELERTARDIAAELRAQGDTGAKLNQDFQTHERDMLRDRIDELLLVQRGKELDIKVDSDVTKYMAGVQRKLAADNPQLGLSDPDKFHDYIRQQAGMSWEDFVAETKNNYLKRAVIGEEVSRKITISDKEIEDYYNAHQKDFIRDEKVCVSEILISTAGKSGAALAASKKKADDLASRASKGERFSDLARDNSDSLTAKQGGELACYKKGELAKEFEDKIWNLPRGGVAAPILISNGYEILKVDDHTKQGLAPLADVKSQIQDILYGPKMEPMVRQYLTQLRKTAFLQIKPGYQDTGASPGQDTKWQDPAVLRPETVKKAEVLAKTRDKRLFGFIPIPGTEINVNGKSTSR
ncbi:MAG TPA: peptidylprolyl isomerase [Bryobacteraceae bacterium]|jgi:parvulin-like peptidyl-prolyl isomerase|nr:peptidylprolyl isomerase [Bryobacteraceae bacterium]